MFRPTAGASVQEVTAFHHKQLTTHIGGGGVVLAPSLGEGILAWFAEELDCTKTEPPQGFKEDRSERVIYTLLVCKVVLEPISILEKGAMVMGTGQVTSIRNK
jgi:hypothetical protein